MASNSSSPRGSVGSRRWIAPLLILALFVLAWFLRSRPQPAPAVEVERAALVLREGRLHVTNATVPFTGFVIEHYPGGALQSRSAVSNGRLEGLSEGWYTNGQVQVREHFVAGVSHGLRTKWHDNGQKQSEAPITEGKLNGMFRRWYPDGGLAEEIPMNEGQPDGVSMAYHPGGFLKARVVLRKGEVLEKKYWDEKDRMPAPSASGGDAPGEK